MQGLRELNEWPNIRASQRREIAFLFSQRLGRRGCAQRYCVKPCQRPNQRLRLFADWTSTMTPSSA